MADASIQPTVLVLDDEKNIRHAIQIALEQEGMHVIAAHDVASAARALDERVVDLMILDIRLGEIDGLAFFRKLQVEGSAVPTIFISGHATLAEAAQAMKIGGFDFLEKPFSAEKISVLARRCLEHAALQQRLHAIEAREGVGEIVGDSPAIQRLIADALKVADTQASVLITGESGTGKELVANLIHANSSRRDAPIVKVNCSAIPENLIESELFGHERGAFTGAHAPRRGLFETAHRGVLFLDEVADLPLGAQAKILRTLQHGEIQKLGAERTLRVDVRVISATHKDLKRCVADGSFREDLYYRLNVVPLRVPSLRERRRDIPLLVNFIVARLCAKHNLRAKQVDADAMHELEQYSWPGNVRELQNLLERVLIMSGDRITLLDLPEEVLAVVDDPGSKHTAQSSLKDCRDQAERDLILATLKKHAGNISRTALDLHVRRPYLHRRMSALGISKKDYFGG
ncbi:MAG TPA: sigma-54 dependent transcriptional regulator [Steroidobacter sp.]|uniref:sigma-54-dependent transcriptional regulator n=1 Tax=Steroidobacter sp. TaxID=1978227 RepID=UPI002ED7963C